MNTFDRNKEIQLLSKTTSNADLALKYKLSESRIGQICALVEKYCENHKLRYYSSCRKCSRIGKKQEDFLKKHPELRERIAKLALAGREAAVVEEKRKIMKLLSEHDFSASHIGELFNNTHATVIYHLKQ